MAKKKDIEIGEQAIVVADTQTKAVALVSSDLLDQMAEVRENFESIDNPKLPRAKMRSEGIELIEGQPLTTQLEGIIVLTKRTNVYYAKPYNPSAITPPDCYSLDGITPETDMRDRDGNPKKPVSPKCKGCPMAEFGTNTMKSGKACRNLKPIYVLLDGAIMPRQLTVAPSSLKAANQYLMDLAERGLAYRKVMTRITAFKKNAADTYMSLKFELARKLNDQETLDTEFIRSKWLPIMQSDIVDQSTVDGGSASPVEDPKGEF